MHMERMTAEHLSEHPLKADETSAKDVSFKFYSFLRCAPTPGKNAGRSHAAYETDGAGVLIIKDSDDESEVRPEPDPQLELLCELEFDSDTEMPRPIESKVEYKVEPTESEAEKTTHNYVQSFERTDAVRVEALALEQADLNDDEDELLTLCKLEPDCDLSELQPTSAPSLSSSSHCILFICPQCGNSFDNNMLWREHIIKTHRLNDYQQLNFRQYLHNKFECNQCKAVITRCTLKTLQQHHFAHLPFKTYKCKLCRYDAGSLYLMISHIMLHKNCEQFSTGLTEKPIGRASNLQTTLLEHESGELVAYVCPACGMTFDTEDSWQAHINFRHNFLQKTAENQFGDHFKCSECGLEIFSQHVMDLQLHLFSHLPFKSFLKCKICGWTISRRSFMLSHILHLHKNVLSACAIVDAAAAVVSDGSQSPYKYSLSYDAQDEPLTVEANALKEKNFSVTSLATSQQVVAINNTQNTSRLQDNNGESESSLMNQSKHMCKRCLQDFSLKADLIQHKCPNMMRCQVCNKVYKYEKPFRKHVRRCSEEAPWLTNSNRA